jgi:hypothetical protein
VQQLKPADGMARQHFAEEMLDRIDLDVDFLKKIMFTDEATFHVSGKVHGHNVRIWGTENPHVVREHIRDSPKVNVWCGVMLHRTWQELEYRLNVLRATKGAHIDVY